MDDRIKTIEGDFNARGLRFGIVASRFNDFIVDRLRATSSSKSAKINIHTACSAKYGCVWQIIAGICISHYLPTAIDGISVALINQIARRTKSSEICIWHTGTAE